MATVFACDLSVFTPDQRERLRDLVAQVFEACGQAEELPDGFRLRFPVGSVPAAGGGGNAAPAPMITEWITLERLCCPCIAFAVEFAAEGGPITVRMTGAEGIKSFLLAEFKGRIAEKLPHAR
ncbi:MAG TPA: hypothetical protein VJT33_02630 [bacterium]|nr:hypothetical protein [bacterium]